MHVILAPLALGPKSVELGFVSPPHHLLAHDDLLLPGHAVLTERGNPPGSCVFALRACLALLALALPRNDILAANALLLFDGEHHDPSLVGGRGFKHLTGVLAL